MGPGLALGIHGLFSTSPRYDSFYFSQGANGHLFHFVLSYLNFIHVIWVVFHLVAAHIIEGQGYHYAFTTILLPNSQSPSIKYHYCLED
jgi:hypothetical protein